MFFQGWLHVVVIRNSPSSSCIFLAALTYKNNLRKIICVNLRNLWQKSTPTSNHAPASPSSSSGKDCCAGCL